MDDYELNNLNYEEAIILDKRKFLEIYHSLLNRKQFILFIFFNRNDYNILYIKVAGFIFMACTHMALNVFLFKDETMHKMFLDNGKYDFIQHFPQIIYSSLISELIELLIYFLILIDKNFYEIKNISANQEDRKKIIKTIKLKINYFFIFTSFIIVFCWYIISCFCAVYKNTQIYFFVDSFISLCLGLLYPFILYLIPSLLRVISLKYHKKRLLSIFRFIL